MYRETLKLKVFRHNTPSLIKYEFGESYTIFGCDEKSRDLPYPIEMYDEAYGQGGKRLFHYIMIPYTYYYV